MPVEGLHPSMPVEAPRMASRSGLPLPPVPAGPRPSVRGTASPDVLAPPQLAGRTPERSVRMSPGAVVAEARSEGPWREDDRSAPWSTGPATPGLSRPDVRVPVPRSVQETATAGSGSSAYGDWTRPSRTPGDDGRPTKLSAGESAKAALPMHLLTGPATTALPERGLSDRRDQFAASVQNLDLHGADLHGADLRGAALRGAALHDAAPREDRPASRSTGPVGGRAALRAERQAADAVRRKATKQGSRSALAVLEEEENPGRRPRRLAVALVAMAVLALTVLSVYSFATPETRETASQTPKHTTAQPTAAPVVTDLPPLETAAPPIDLSPAAPVRVPVTVLNATDINGLAAQISGAVVAGGWESAGVGTYTTPDVATTTVFFTEGDETQRLAGVELVNQFPGWAGPVPRFFEVPDVATPGLVVVATGNWKP